jgi:hypothetical protein
MPKSSAPRRQKIGGNMAQVQPDRGKEQREWNGKRDDEGRANVEKKQEQDHADQNHSFRQVVHHGAGGVVEEIAAIEHGNDFHAGGRMPLLS